MAESDENVTLKLSVVKVLLVKGLKFRKLLEEEKMFGWSTVSLTYTF